MDDPPGFGLYVHWPFCQAKCPYCDFNSHVVAQVDQSRWAAALVSEIERLGGLTGRRVLTSIFFGGGTPSLMQADTVAAVIGAATRVWASSNSIEITLEANPTSVEAERFVQYREAGVNRVSLGVQSLRDYDLRALGRLHSVEEAKSAVQIAQKVFDRVSFDLIYARQHQTLHDWKHELSEALAMASGHLSLYQLTIEPDTAFGERFKRGGLKGLPEDDVAADMYELTQEMTTNAGLPAYEISNHARPGEESRHNMIYWSAGDWAAVGPGGHGRLTLNGQRFATKAWSQPGKWLAEVEKSGTGDEEVAGLSEQEAKEEAIIMGLRTTRGVPRLLFSETSDFLKKIKYLECSGLLKSSEERLRTTEAGRPLLNAILRELLA